MSEFTSIVSYSPKETPLTVEWAAKNFEVVYHGTTKKTYLINRQADCYLVLEHKERDFNGKWKLQIHYAVFEVKYIEELEWICKSLGIRTTQEQEMSIFVTRRVTTRTPITKDLIKSKFSVSVSYGTIGNIEYLIDEELKMWLAFRTEGEGDEETTYIYCTGTSTRMKVNYIEEIKWAIDKLKAVKK